MRRLVIALLVLTGLLVVADFGAAALAESAVSRQMRSQLGLADDPAVRINGFPFLTQALSGRYGSVDVEADRIAFGELQELSVSAQLQDVDAPLAMLLGSGAKTLKVAEAEGTVRVAAADVERLVPEAAGLALTDLRIETLDRAALERAAEDDDEPELADLDPERTVRLVATATVPSSLPVALPGISAGDEVEARVIASLDPGDGRIRITPRHVGFGGDRDLQRILTVLRGSILDDFTLRIDPGSLPLDVTPTDVRAVNGRLEITGEARDLVLGAGSPLSAG
jgi:hypothetical protein